MVALVGLRLVVDCVFVCLRNVLLFVVDVAICDSLCRLRLMCY